MTKIDFLLDKWYSISGIHFSFQLSATHNMIINVSSMEASVGQLTSEPESDFVHHIALYAALLCVCIVIGHLLEESRWMNESITALAIVSFTLLNRKSYA